MSVEVIYLARNRLEFTRFTFEMLLANTDWSLVDQLIVYDDGSQDGTKQYLYDAIHNCPVEYHLRERLYGSPVAVMNDYVETSEADWFSKIDNDIVVPPGWLGDLLSVTERNESVELIGMEAGRCGLPTPSWDGIYRFLPASHMGGVGLIRTETIGRRRKMEPNGRFGWTEWQHEFKPVRGWIYPDLLVCSLDQLPFEPWNYLAAKYVEQGYSRAWPAYFERWAKPYWEWWRK